MQKGRLIGQGRTAEIFEWDEGKALKLFREGYSKTAAENEYMISRRLFTYGIPTAEVFDLIEYEGRWGIIYELINGPSMMKLISVKPWGISRAAKKMAELHRAVQKEIDSDFPQQKDRLRKNIASSDMLTEDIKRKLYEYIEKHPSGNILCHGDFHPDNILICGGKTVVVDWMDATKGNPLADVARTSVLFKYADVPQEKSRFEKSIINFFRKKFFSDYIKHYLKISGVNIEQVEEWELPVAAARLREGLPGREREALANFVNNQISEIYRK